MRLFLRPFLIEVAVMSGPVLIGQSVLHFLYTVKSAFHLHLKQAYTLDPTKIEWADYAAVQALSGNLSGNGLTHNLSGNTQSQSSQLTEPLWTDPGLKSGLSMCELISTIKKKKRSTGVEWMVSPKICAREEKAASKMPPPHSKEWLSDSAHNKQWLSVSAHNKQCISFSVHSKQCFSFSAHSKQCFSFYVQALYKEKSAFHFLYKVNSAFHFLHVANCFLFSAHRKQCFSFSVHSKESESFIFST